MSRSPLVKQWHSLCMASMTLRIKTLGGVAVAVLAAAGASLSASILFAGPASAYCYSAECVPNVARNVIEGAPCVWAAAGPLIGVYNVTLPCPSLNLSAQGSDGVPLQCAAQGTQLRWVHRAGIPG